MTRTFGSILLSTAAAVSLSACATYGDTDTASTSDTTTTTAATERPMTNPMVGGAEMYPTYTIVQNASNASNLSTLVAAVQAAGLVDTLNGTGPFTVFAPLNSAFDRLAPGTVDNLLKPENKAALTKVLTYHVVPGDVSAKMLMDKIAAGGGEAVVDTVAGEQLKFSIVNGDVAVTDANGTSAYVQTADVKQKNGVVHTINGVLIPTL